MPNLQPKYDKSLGVKPIIYFGLLMFSLLIVSCNKTTDPINPVVVDISKPASTYPVDIATKWTDLQLQLIKNSPEITPPYAARVLGYMGLALYESVVPGMKGYQSLAGQLQDLKALPKIDSTKEYSWGLAANAAVYTLTKEMFANVNGNSQSQIDSLRRNFESSLKVDVSQDVIDRSIRFGAEIATAIWEYAKVDGGHEAYLSNFPSSYVVQSGIGYWEPTNNQLQPLLPYWYKVRTFVTTNKKIAPPKPIPFSYREESDFFSEAQEVYLISKNLSDEQRTIARFWADGSTTITPPGHHFNIASIVIKSKNSSLPVAAETYCKLGIAINDAFIACWSAKYKYLLMRPQTYIRETLQKNWISFLSTPPFPEYTSGHSSGAGAASTILASIFGEQTSFIDNTYQSTLGTRSFSNFTDYANESSISRVYGGIHYRNSCDKGLENGRKIGYNVLNLKFKK